MQEHAIICTIICYGVGKRYSRLRLLWSETTLSLFGFVTRFILQIRQNNMTMTHEHRNVNRLRLNRQSFYRNRKRQLVPIDPYRF